MDRNANASSQGYLTVRVFSGEGVFPVEGAMVTVMGEDGSDSDVKKVGYTDEAGIAGPFTLDTGSGNFNTPDSGAVAYRYTVEVEKKGSFNAVKSGVAVYPGENSIQTLYLAKLPNTEGSAVVGDMTDYSGTSDGGDTGGVNGTA